MKLVLSYGYALLDGGYVPDFIVRFFVRRMLEERRAPVRQLGVAGLQAMEEDFIDQASKQSHVALLTDKANEQHYEVPTPYFLACLGPRLKYSACEFPPGSSLEQAEEATFFLYEQRAQLEDGLHVLDLGCGWGSLSLWLLERFPNMRVTSISNSTTQKTFIEQRARERGYHHRLQVHVCDINDLTAIPPSSSSASDEAKKKTISSSSSSKAAAAMELSFFLHNSFDRIMSIEMMEHCSNHAALMSCLQHWLRPRGLLFVHVFTHHHYSYRFEDRDATDWMARTFFSGGVMPHHELLSRQASRGAPALALMGKWKQNGMHYSRTLDAWLQRMDANETQVRAIFAQCYGPDNVQMWISRWRTFYMACSELFADNGGNTWYVTHYLWRNEKQ